MVKSTNRGLWLQGQGLKAFTLQHSVSSSECILWVWSEREWVCSRMPHPPKMETALPSGSSSSLGLLPSSPDLTCCKSRLISCAAPNRTPCMLEPLPLDGSCQKQGWVVFGPWSKYQGWLIPGSLSSSMVWDKSSSICIFMTLGAPWFWESPWTTELVICSVGVETVGTDGTQGQLLG